MNSWRLDFFNELLKLMMQNSFSWDIFEFWVTYWIDFLKYEEKCVLQTIKSLMKHVSVVTYLFKILMKKVE